jgi:hypothetical protein
MIFEVDHERDGYSVEIYTEPDANGMMDFLGRIDLFSGWLYLEDGREFEIPHALVGRDAIRAWATAKL